MHEKRAETSELRHALKDEKQGHQHSAKKKGKAKPGPGQWAGSPDGKAIAFFRDCQDEWEDAGWFRAHPDQQVL